MAKNRLERLMGMNERLVGIVILLTTSKPHLRLNFAKLGVEIEKAWKKWRCAKNLAEEGV